MGRCQPTIAYDDLLFVGVLLSAVMVFVVCVKLNFIMLHLHVIHILLVLFRYLT